MANTKLTTEQKTVRKDNIAYYGDKLTFGYSDRFTVARIEEFPGARMARYSISYAALDEQKIRRKVGEYYTLMSSSFPLPAKFTAQDVADMFAYLDDDETTW